MSNKTIIGLVIAAAIVIAGVMIVYNNMTELSNDKNTNNDKEEEEIWNTAGAFGINKHTYKLGEDIFFAGHLMPDQQVLIRVANPEGKIILEKFYSGIERDLIKFYFKPDTSASSGIYTKEQLIGKWMMWFEGVNSNVIYFNITDQFVPGAEKDIIDLKNPNAQTQQDNPDMITVVRPP